MSAGVAAPTEKYSLYEKYKTDLQKDEAPSYVTYPYVLRCAHTALLQHPYYQLQCRCYAVSDRSHYSGAVDKVHV